MKRIITAWMHAAENTGHSRISAWAGIVMPEVHFVAGVFDSSTSY